jgi:hypothetical protein
MPPEWVKLPHEYGGTVVKNCQMELGALGSVLGKHGGRVIGMRKKWYRCHASGLQYTDHSGIYQYANGKLQ